MNLPLDVFERMLFNLRRMGDMEADPSKTLSRIKLERIAKEADFARKWGTAGPWWAE